MTFRRFLAIIIALTISVSFCSCNFETTTKTDNNTNSDFEDLLSDLSNILLKQLEEEQKNQDKLGSFVVLSHTILEDGLEQYILYDSKTMVMFSYVEGNHGGGLSELYNADGTLRIYSPEEDETE